MLLARDYHRTVRHFFFKRFPGPYLAIHSIAARVLFGGRTLSVRRDARRAIFGAEKTPQVKAGPFRGMRYDVGHTWGLPTNKWLGTYEAELNPVVEEIVQLNPTDIFDIGCAEGYYAVGLARRLPSARVWAFDADPISLWQCRRLARANGVSSRVKLRGFCTPESLGRVLTERSLIVCDIEGGEIDVLDPKRIPMLRQCWLLIETHQLGVGPEWSGARLRERFSATHFAHEIKQQPRHPALIGSDFIERPNDAAIVNWMDEMRSPEQAWLWLTPKT